ncbi:head maturation protease, ClpP-related [Pseudoclostridium thermosuccinogenes]|uniref:head maturation protease, ClpP-related n=1 Tax=Clostridium thermosuccinogenes TaxID=84032 RepID=UPI002FDB5543
MKILEFKNKDQNGQLKTVGKFEIKNLTEDTAELYIYGDIVSSEWAKWDDSDICPNDVANFLKQLDGTNKLNIFINSGGGSVFAGLAIYHQLKRNSAEKTVYVDGLAGSISSVIAFCGDRIVVPTDAFLMIHKPWMGLLGAYNAIELRKMADDLDRIEEGIMNVYGQHLKEGVDIETIRQMVQEETWLTGDKAAEYFDIEVGEAVNAAACTSMYFEHYAKIPEKIKCQPEPQKDNNEKEKLLLELDLI